MVAATVKRVFLRSILLPLIALCTTPFAAARESYYTGISPLNNVVQLISKIFDIPLLKNATVQEGFLRFALFALFLVVAHFSFKRIIKDNKTSGVIATVFAIISAFLMPKNWVFANGGVITAVFSALIPLGVVGLGIWFCLSKKYLNKSFVTRLIGIAILFMLLAILDVYHAAIGLPIALLIPNSFWRRG